AQRIRQQRTEGLIKAISSHVRPDLELRSLRRTRRLLGWLRWLFGFAIAFTAIGLALDIRFVGGHIQDVRLPEVDYPAALGTIVAPGLAFWIGSSGLRRRLRTSLH